MHIHPNPRPDAPAADPPGATDAARRRAIAHAIWTEIHWLFPRDRRVTVTVDGDDVAVALGPSRTAVPPAAQRPEVSP